MALCKMILDHSCYQSNNPLPSGASITQAFFSKKYPEPNNGRFNRLIDEHLPTMNSKAAPRRTTWADKNLLERIKIYRPVMEGNGWMTCLCISERAGVHNDSARQRLKSLEESGHVERIKDNNLVRFRWIAQSCDA